MHRFVSKFLLNISVWTKPPYGRCPLKYVQIRTPESAISVTTVSNVVTQKRYEDREVLKQPTG